ncbi:MAG: HAD family hydrolase [Methanophagales archaeon]|nr:HAD family hydrolase [Methanophagales archaeon]
MEVEPGVGIRMSELAVVFDGAGVLYAPFRIIKDIERGVTKRSRVSGITCTDWLERGAMTILKTRYEETLEKEEPSKILSDLMREKKIENKVIYKKKGVSDSEVVEAILRDKNVKLKDVHETMSFLRRCDILPVIGVGLIMDMARGVIKYVIAGGINFFPGTLKLFKELRAMGILLFLASGDRIEGEEMAAYLPDIPADNIFGMMKPEDKRELVRKLKEEHKVMMVGDDRNDYLAMWEADIAVLSLQEEADRPGKIFEVADFRIKDIGEVKEIIEEIG